MWHEISQYDIPDRQLLATKAQSRVSRWKDIGEAKITHTIFGNARVRIVREQDKIRRARLLILLAVVVLAAVAWQVWIEMNRISQPPLSARIQVSAPAFQPEYLPNAAAPSSVGSKPGMPSRTQTINPATSRKDLRLQALGLNSSEQIAVKPAAPQALPASRTQTTSPATNSSSSKNQTDMQQLPMQSAPIQPATPIVKTPIVIQPAASSTAVAAPLASSLVKEVTSAPSPAGGNQSPAPVNEQVK